MTLDKLLQYVILDVDDTDYTLEQIIKWFNKGIANYNLIPPLTTYPFYTEDYQANNPEDELAIDLGYGDEYPLSNNFMLGVMLPYINGAVKAQEESVDQKYANETEYRTNALKFKSASNIASEYLLNQKNTDLDAYQIGEGVYIGDDRYAPFAGEWSRGSYYWELDEEE